MTGVLKLSDSINVFADCSSHLHYDFDNGSCVSQCPCGFIGFDYHTPHYCEPGTVTTNQLPHRHGVFSFKVHSNIH